MAHRIGFDNQRYTQLQSARIRERIDQFGGKLYLEFGGKLFDDYHASRVLPGFAPDSKIRMLKKLSDSVEILIAINASAIEQSKKRGDIGITYDEDVLRLTDAFRSEGLYVGSVVITQYAGQEAANLFRERLQSLGIRVYLHYPIEGYPHNIEHIVSPEGYGKNDYVETTRPLVVVTAPGPGSGKMATCLSQLYHEHLRGVQAGYAKFETFPVWDLPLKHPVNLAYEAATADLSDVNMIDPFHLSAYGVTTVNYNRDVEIYPVLETMFCRILGQCPYKSPTDMGVNVIRSCIVDEDAVCDAAKQEIVRRYYAARCDQRRNGGMEQEVYRLELLMKQAQITDEIRPVIAAAAAMEEKTGMPASAIELPDGKIVCGKTSELMGPSSSVLLNALKALAGINPRKHLISRSAIEPIQRLKTEFLGSQNPRLHSDEILIALAISAAKDEAAAKALAAIPLLKDCEAHLTVIQPSVDIETYHRLNLRVTSSPKYQTNQLYHR